MNPSHHPEPEELLGYASGGSPEWSSLLVACHLTFCPDCRSDVALYDDLGGALLDALAPDPTAAASLPIRVDARRTSEPAPKAPVAMPDPCLPRPLFRYLGTKPRWRFLTPSVAHMPLSLQVNGHPLRLFRFQPGYVIPAHGHRGTESILVLRGSLGDSRNETRYRTGDLCRNEPGAEHSQDVGTDEPCISLVVNEGRLVPKSLWGRILQRIAGV